MLLVSEGVVHFSWTEEDWHEWDGILSYCALDAAAVNSPIRHDSLGTPWTIDVCVMLFSCMSCDLQSALEHLGDGLGAFQYK